MKKNDNSSQSQHNLGPSNWRAEMVEKGYIQGPLFSSYDDLAKWDLKNQRPHIRTRLEEGYQVYFTDGQSYDENKLDSTFNENVSEYQNYKEPPF